MKIESCNAVKWKNCDLMDVPALNSLALLFHIWQAGSHVQPESGFGHDETVPECLTVLLESFQLEQVSICSSAFPIRRSSTHRARNKHSTKIDQSKGKIINV